MINRKNTEFSSMTKISVTKRLVLDDKYRIAEKVLVVKLSVFSSGNRFFLILILERLLTNSGKCFDYF